MFHPANFTWMSSWQMAKSPAAQYPIVSICLPHRGMDTVYCEMLILLLQMSGLWAALLMMLSMNVSLSATSPGLQLLQTLPVSWSTPKQECLLSVHISLKSLQQDDLRGLFRPSWFRDSSWSAAAWEEHQALSQQGGRARMVRLGPISILKAKLSL